MKLAEYREINTSGVIMQHPTRLDRDGDLLLACLQSEDMVQTFAQNKWVIVVPSFIPPEALEQPTEQKAKGRPKSK